MDAVLSKGRTFMAVVVFGLGLAKPGAIAGEAGVACWRGPDGSGACPEMGLKLIEDLSQAKRLWISEDRGFSIGYSALGASKTGFASFRSGYSSPVAVDGRVYLAYFKPTGWDPAPGKGFSGEDLAKIKELTADKTGYVGDDVVLCADAETGKTIWRQVFKGNAIAFKGGSKYGTHITPCVADGKLFFRGPNYLCAYHLRANP
jgi:outer membrane protein assembly factor BamB